MSTHLPDRIDPAPFEPSEDELHRTWTRTARTMNGVPRPNRRRPRVPRFAVAFAIGLAILAGAALAPDWIGGDDAQVGRPATASAALRSAGAAAADADWRPLADGGYHHVFAATFRPGIKAVFDTGENEGAPGLGPVANETWLDANGRGVRLEFWGGPGDPDIYPDVGKPDANGERNGFGYSGEAMRRPWNPEASLRHADAVDVWSWKPGTDQAMQEFWVRTPDGYILARRGPTGTMHVAGKRAFERAQIRYWGDTLERLSSLDGIEGEALDAAILDLLDGNPVDNSMNAAFPIVGQMGITEESRAEERRIERAVQLLGTAPLAPRARRAIFEWLAGRDTARLDGPVRDGLGRAGTRVTFETRYDEPEPARTVTIDDLVDQQRAIKTIVEGPIPDIGPWKVPAHREQRRWFVTVTFDTRSGDLLEYATRTEVNTTTKLPWLSGTYTGPLDDLKPTWDVMWNELGSGSETGTRYLARERTTAIEPMAEVCGDDPRICAP